MIFFAHLGLTYAAAAVIEKAAQRDEAEEKSEIRGSISRGKVKTVFDYRFILIGAILPDLLDKPAIYFLSSESVHSGRVFAHTLLFVILLTCLGLLIRNKYGKSWLLYLAGGSLAHLVLDSMWLFPVTLFWPFYDLFSSHIHGLGNTVGHAFVSILNQPFDSVSVESILGALSDPYKGIPELAGFLIIAFVLVRLVSGKKLLSFLKTGQM